MKFGYLSDHFDGAGAKKLRDVEVNPKVSNQHELNGVQEFMHFLGDAAGEYIRFDCFFYLIGDEEEDLITDRGNLTWYDARYDHPTRSEHRFYYSSNDVINNARSNDLLVLAKEKDKDSVLFIVCPEGSTAEQQLLWLFGIESISGTFSIKHIRDGEAPELGYAAGFILEQIDLDVRVADRDYLTDIFKAFGSISWYPSTAKFSAFTRSYFDEQEAIDDPDKALMKWIEHEEMLFKTLEEHIVSERINNRFESVDEFVSFSLSVHNRRKSRAGHAFENHLERIFQLNGLSFTRKGITENKNEPDFLFPGQKEYHDPDFPSRNLFMLGVKSSCKERWRQVLAEAERIDKKHLITLEPGISEYQTEQMKANSLQLLIPRKIQNTFTERQRSYIINLSDFIQL